MGPSRPRHCTSCRVSRSSDNARTQASHGGFQKLEVGQPFCEQRCIVGGEAPGHRLIVLGIDQDHLQAPLQDIEQRFLGDSSALHGDTRAPHPCGGNHRWCRPTTLVILQASGQQHSWSRAVPGLPSGPVYHTALSSTLVRKLIITLIYNYIAEAEYDFS
jgi:hypothetical protein